MTSILIALASVPGLALAGDDGLRAQRLFHIERNKNANIVVYDAMVEADGNLPKKDRKTVEVYWLRLAEDGRRRKLKRIERRLAYGIKVKGRTGNRLTLKMRAKIGRPLTVDGVDGVYRAFIEIAGRPAILERVYIFAEEKAVMPEVKYLELFGTDLETGEEAYEKLEP